MGLKDITRTATGAYINAVKWPLSRAARVVGRGNGKATGPEVLVERADAKARAVAGTVTGDEKLKAEARKKGAAADQRERAVKLRKQAAEAQTQVEKNASDTEAKAQERRQKAAADERKRKAQADKQREQTEMQAEEAAERRKKDAQEAKAKVDGLNEDKEQRERREVLAEKEKALSERDSALTAKDEAARLESAASRTKAQRKA